jgi:hypothetical protein
MSQGFQDLAAVAAVIAFVVGFSIIALRVLAWIFDEEDSLDSSD